MLREVYPPGMSEAFRGGDWGAQSRVGFFVALGNIPCGDE